MDGLVFEDEGDPGVPTSRAEHSLRYKPLDSLKADDMGVEKINKYPHSHGVSVMLASLMSFA